MSTFVHLFHIFFVGSLFIYIGIKQKQMPSFVFHGLSILGAFIIAFHLYKAYSKFIEKKAIWVNLFHILVIGPMLLAIGVYGESTPRYMFEFILMLGFASIGYHGYYLSMGE